MSVIKAQTTAAELVTAFGFSSLQQMEAYLKRHQTKASGSKESDDEIVSLASQLFAVISERNQTGQKWQSGKLTTILSKGELVKANDDLPGYKNRRYKLAGQIGKALKLLADEGVMEKPHVNNPAHSHYLLIEGATFGSQAEPEILGLPGPVGSEEIVEAEIVEAEIIDPDAENTMEGFIEASVEMGEIEPPKPKTRRRRRQK